jgi:hypothetical protein
MPTAKPSSNKGRKPRHAVDRCRTAFWAWAVREELQLSFDEIERLLNPEASKKRDDLGGYSQPGRWRIYRDGGADPIGGHRSKIKEGSHLSEAAKYYPYSLDIYNSVLWRLLRASQITKELAEDLINELEPYSARRLMKYDPKAKTNWEVFLKMTYEEIEDYASSARIDVLAVLLVSLKLPRFGSQYSIIRLLRRWLFLVNKKYLPYQKTCKQMIPLIQVFAPELKTAIDENGFLFITAPSDGEGWSSIADWFFDDIFPFPTK